jgi:hypothetical protein
MYFCGIKFKQLKLIIMESITIDNLKSLEKLQYADAYVKVNSYSEGRDAACDYFKSMYNGENWDDNLVHIRGGKSFDDEERGVRTVVYESFLDSGSVDYFFFSFESAL